MTKGPVSYLRLALFPLAGITSGGEVLYTGPQICRASVEYGSATPPQFTVNGQYEWTISPNGGGGLQLTDPLGIYIPAATGFWIRTHKRIACAPTSPSASPSAGGALASGTELYYELTTVDNGIESGPTAEFNATPSSTNLSVTLSWTTPAYGQTINIYRGTVSGGSKYLLASLKIPTNSASMGYIDTGYSQPLTSAWVPTSTQDLKYDRQTMNANESSNAIYLGGTGLDVTGSTGAISGGVGPNGDYLMAPNLLLGDDTANVGVVGLGDSIQQGIAIPGILGFNSNWFDLGWSDGGFNSANLSVASSTILQFITNTKAQKLRLSALLYADYVVSNLGINDLSAGQTWQQIAANHLLFAAILAQRGIRYVLATLLPKTSSTTAWTDVSNQTTGGYETARQNYNSWLRAGCQVNGSGAPVLTGGTPSSLIFGVFDGAAAIEVNASNVLTQNGGLWQAPASATYTAQVLTGTPSATSLPVSTASYPVPAGASNGLETYAIKMTSGAANGQVAIIKTNTATGLTLYASGDTTLTGLAFTGLSTVPSAGDTFSIYQINSLDGTHPPLGANATIGASWATWAAANLVPFGAA